MKKLLLSLASLAIISCSREKKAEGNLHITGNIKGLKQGTLYIQKLEDTALVAIDTIAIKGDSNFESHLKIDSPEMLYLFLDRGETNSIDNNIMFFAEPGKMTISTTLEKFFADAKITGSKNQKLFEDYKKIMSRFKDAQLALTEQKLRAFQFKKEAPADLDEKNADNLKRRYLFSINFAMNNRDYEIAPYIALAEVSDANLKYLDTINNALAPKVASSKYGKMLAKFIADRKKEENNLYSTSSRHKENMQNAAVN
ncbi:MAG TPA: DUF4369 domain-containing protein [Flavobacterium sp.]|nr:DUF4369 domain-containing protein [Flavobacterium sp.]